MHYLDAMCCLQGRADSSLGGVCVVVARVGTRGELEGKGKWETYYIVIMQCVPKKDIPKGMNNTCYGMEESAYI